MAQFGMEKMIRLILFFAGNESLTLKDIAIRLEVTERCIQINKNRLEDLGLSCIKVGKYFKLDIHSKTFVRLSGLAHFTEEESMLMKTVAECLPESHVMKQNIIRRIDQVYETKQLVDHVVRIQNRDNIHNLLEAIEHKKQVILRDYASANSNEVRDRIVEPFKFTTNMIQIWCFDPESQTNKLFKTERIERVEVVDHEWLYEKMHQVGCEDIFRICTPDRIRVRLKMNVRAAHLLLEEYPKSEEFLTKLDDNHWMLDTIVCSLKGVGRFVMGLMNDIEVVKTPKLKEYLTQEMKSGLKKLKEKNKKCEK